MTDSRRRKNGPVDSYRRLKGEGRKMSRERRRSERQAGRDIRRAERSAAKAEKNMGKVARDQDKALYGNGKGPKTPKAPRQAKAPKTPKQKAPRTSMGTKIRETVDYAKNRKTSKAYAPERPPKAKKNTEVRNADKLKAERDRRMKRGMKRMEKVERKAQRQVARQTKSAARKEAFNNSKIGKVGRAVRKGMGEAGVAARDNMRGAAGKVGKRTAPARERMGTMAANGRDRMGVVGKGVKRAVRTKGEMYLGKDKLGRMRRLRRKTALTTTRGSRMVGGQFRKTLKYGMGEAGINAGALKNSKNLKDIGKALGGRGTATQNFQRLGLAYSGYEAGNAIKRANDRRTGKSKEEGGIAGDLGKIAGGVMGGWAGERLGNKAAGRLKGIAANARQNASSHPRSADAMAAFGGSKRAKVAGGLARIDDLSKMSGAKGKTLAKVMGARGAKGLGQLALIGGASLATGALTAAASRKAGNMVDKKVGEMRRKRTRRREA